jgi:hypothetical protein
MILPLGSLLSCHDVPHDGAFCHYVCRQMQTLVPSCWFEAVRFFGTGIGRS